MRKIVAAVLCAVMCLAAFTGCSKAELGYLSMCRGMMDTMESCQVKGQTQIEVDFDSLRGFVAAVERELGDSGAAEGMEGLTGRHAVQLDYTMKMNMGQMAYSVDMDMTYQGTKYALGGMYFGMAEGVSVSPETLMGIYRLTRDIAKGADDSFFFTAEYEKALSDAIGTQYISLVSAEELGVSPADLKAAMPEGGFSGLYDAAFQLYEDMLEGFENGETLLKEIPGGYQIDVEGRAAGRLLANILDFLAAHPDQLLGALETYMVEVAKQAGTADAEGQMRAAFEELKGNTAEMSEALREVSAMWKELMQEDVVQIILSNLHYRAGITQSGGRYVSEGETELAYNGKPAISIATKATCEKASASISFPKTGVSIEDLGDKLVTVTNRFNPAVGAVVTWGFESTATQATLDVKRRESAPMDITGDSELAELVVRNGRAYVPLRAICDMLGENVTWNKDERRAYVAKDGKDIAMEGILEGGKSFVGVREFEKLGYTVTYRSVDGLKEATITR